MNKQTWRFAPRTTFGEEIPTWAEPNRSVATSEVVLAAIASIYRKRGAGG